MARDLTEGVIAAAQAGTVHVAVLMEAEFASGTVNTFTGYGTLSVGGTDYMGTGDLLAVDMPAETAEIEGNNATFQLSGVDEADISIALSPAEYRGRRCRTKLAFFDADAQLVADPVRMYSGKMDVMVINDDPGQGPVLTMTSENDMAKLGRTRLRNRTHEDQQIDYPGDTFLKRVTALQNKEIIW